jgi:CubicO group peptidase (beta-lactamase class C family)
MSATPTLAVPAGAALPLARPDEVGLSPAGLARLGAVFQREIDRGQLPGVAIAVARNGRLAYQTCLGRLDPAHDAPMTADAIFRIYSMTKPIVSVATMMLVEEGRLGLGDPVAALLPEFAQVGVGVARTPPARPMTVQDLLRHTSGLCYDFTGDTDVHRLHAQARLGDARRTNAQAMAELAALPLIASPGERWEYSRSTDVLGRIIEVVDGCTLGESLARRVFGPLHMTDTGFHVPAAQQHRIAEPFPVDPDTGAAVRLLDARRAPPLESGGGGLMSTLSDYLRFMQMMLDGGRLDGVRLLSRKTVELMTADHLGAIPNFSELLPVGFGFGLGFAVRLQAGVAQTPGSTGTYFWGGIAGTSFWIDPAEKLCAVLMVQAPGQRDRVRTLFRNGVYAAFAD